LNNISATTCQISRKLLETQAKVCQSYVRPPTSNQIAYWAKNYVTIL